MGKVAGIGGSARRAPRISRARAQAFLLTDQGRQYFARRGKSDFQKLLARDFVADAVAHCKFVAHVPAAAPLLEKAGVEVDEGFFELDGPDACEGFVTACRELRFWKRAAEAG